jgi:pimeloyl-ACP methyl ester carboxylesterase
MSDGDTIDFEVYGNDGPFVFLGPQIYLTPPMPIFETMAHAYVDGLEDRYRLIVADWPRGTGNSSPAKASSMTWQNAVADLHAIANAAGADRFAWWGYSFGAAVGLQLAPRTDRVSALVCGGFPPLWQPLSDMLFVVRRMVGGKVELPEEAAGIPDVDPEYYRQSVAFYESVAGHDDAAAIRDITCPRMVFHDVDDTIEMAGLTHDLSGRTRAAEAELKTLGWEVNWIETGMAHMAMMNAQGCLDAFAPFLDRVLL